MPGRDENRLVDAVYALVIFAELFVMEVLAMALDLLNRNPIARIVKSSKTWLGVAGLVTILVAGGSLEDVLQYLMLIVPLIIAANTSEDVAKKVGAGIVEALKKIFDLKNAVPLLLVCLVLLPGCVIPFVGEIKVVVDRVHIPLPTGQATADVCLEFKGQKLCAVVEVDKVMFETSAPPAPPAPAPAPAPANP